MGKSILLVVFSLSTLLGFTQVKEQPMDSITEKLIIIEGDSIMHSSIALDEVYVFSKLKFSTYKDKLRYYILRRKTIKVFPYAKLVAERLSELNDSLTKIKRSENVKNIPKKFKNIVKESFPMNLKNLPVPRDRFL